MRTPDTAIIPSGGLGTRMQPMTHWIPKELLPVALTPLIHWALSEAANAGLARAIVVTNPAKPILGDVARKFMMRADLQVVLVSQDRPAGLGDDAGASPWAISRSPWSSPRISSAVPTRRQQCSPRGTGTPPPRF
jgi:CTP:molybdopterin cytidylyltransferase MocA